MKACNGFILRNIVGEYMLVPTGERMKSFNGTMMLNELAAFVWEQLQSPKSESELLNAVLAEYDIDEETASADLMTLLKKFQGLGIIED
ncbi:MAG: PqqD family protein [Lachnospiraceae bacterium]|nr:PqqD family protein [Lachnospiraceae bacterium]